MIKKSAILKLQTEEGWKSGHDECSSYLFGEAAKLLLNLPKLEVKAQEKLLADVTPVFSEADNIQLE